MGRIKDVNQDLKYINHSHLKSYTIDNIDSVEIDDAISLQREHERYLIWIHIANPTDFILNNKYAEEQALKKSESLYLIEQNIPMLPINENKELIGFNTNYSTDSLSACIELDDRGKIIHSNIFKTRIKPIYSLTYEEADELIDLAPREEPELNLLYQLMIRRYKYRKKNGAITINQNKGRFINSICNPKLIIYEKTHSRFMIEELMVLMGYVLADYSKQRNIPIIFRNQEGLNCKSITISNNLNYAISNKLKKAYYSVKPYKHIGLGLNIYSHSTSPLRRFADLLCITQITKFIEGHLLYSEEELIDKLDIISKKSRENTEIYRQEQIICLVNWLNHNKNKDYDAILISWLNTKDSKALIRIEDIEMDIVCFIISNRNLKIYQKINISLDRIKKNNDIIFQDTVSVDQLRYR